MMELTEVRIKARDGFELAADHLMVENPKAVILLIHGAAEYKDRYHGFMQVLAENGYASVISDNRGHGKSVNTEYPKGYMDGVDRLVSDQNIIVDYIDKRHPAVPIVMFGHSFGSLIARCYLQTHDSRLSALILSGTVNYNPMVKLGLAISRLVMKLSGPHGYSKLIAAINVVGKEDISWLSYNQENIEKYRVDPNCGGFVYQNSGSVTIFEADEQLHEFTKFRCQNPSLPILNITGKEDPVTGGVKGLTDSLDSLRRVGYSLIENIVYSGMKHEILNEDNRELVHGDIIKFLNRIIINPSLD